MSGSDMPESIVLTMLRAIGGDLAELRTDMQETKERLGLLEAGQASLSRMTQHSCCEV
jgi:hypothetical protein